MRIYLGRPVSVIQTGQSAVTLHGCNQTGLDVLLTVDGIYTHEETTMKKLVRSLFILLMVLATTIAWSADLEMVLAPPLQPAQGGDVVVLDLYLHNHTDVSIVRDLPPT